MRAMIGDTFSFEACLFSHVIFLVGVPAIHLADYQNQK